MTRHFLIHTVILCLLASFVFGESPAAVDAHAHQKDIQHPDFETLPSVHNPVTGAALPGDWSTNTTGGKTPEFRLPILNELPNQPGVNALSTECDPPSNRLLGSYSAVASSSPKRSNTGFLDFNFYPYTKVATDSAATINALANLDHGFQYFSLTNFNRDGSRDELQEFDTFLTEQHLRWKPAWSWPIAFAGQALIRSSADNDVLRMGPRFTLHDSELLKPLLTENHIKYWFAIYGAQFDHARGYQWQMEHVFRWDIMPKRLNGRVYLSGFADHNIDQATGRGTWVEEAQLGFRLAGDLYFVAEQRYNGFRVGNESSMGLGMQYIIRFK